MHIEHFLFFPVVVLLALILIVLSWKVLLRLLAFFIVILFFWYLLYLAGFVDSPYGILREYRLHEMAQKQSQATL